MTPLYLLWDNFGPLHLDRLEACARHFAGTRRVIGLELCGHSDTYGWETGGTAAGFEWITAYPGTRLDALSARQIFAAIRQGLGRHGRGDVFLCHNNEPGVLMGALWARARGHRVFAMGCSKFDDKPRRARAEALKSAFFLPYHGALGSGVRGRDYYRFLGLSAARITGEYNTVSLDRIRAQAGYGPFEAARIDEGPRFAERDFLCVARLVPKKNLDMLLRAFALYRVADPAPRRLHLLGDGPEEARLRALAAELGLGDAVCFHGFVQSAQVSAQLARGLALLLPSLEDQFGNVVPEALALGLPLILSDNPGARDRLLRSGRNGFLVEPDNPEGMAWFLQRLGTDAALWREMRSCAFELAPQADTARFAEGIARLINMAGR
ncbi:glycosyltransferase [Paenirhodobacter sp. CAU 1674]|uniref:glycosyltransferase n=1 Tax=Paenirhodobacter sp. CAU 1674 TaxID=3032596 RepID=UPI0023DB0284|nr:glycosyltransferase [Paenirhodobacter sp. CAU 1674]MDF2142040.1 glycosyltransferase [Paenirhodobacter sp. CAU 1674]